jgi:hypothetical protein
MMSRQTGQLMGHLMLVVTAWMLRAALQMIPGVQLMSQMMYIRKLGSSSSRGCLPTTLLSS